VQKLGVGAGGGRKRTQRDLERCFESFRGRGRDRLGNEGEQSVVYEFDGLADEIGEPGGQAGMLERLDGPAQGLEVLDRDF
jgi:hypothetical protein